MLLLLAERDWSQEMKLLSDGQITPNTGPQLAIELGNYINDILYYWVWFSKSDAANWPDVEDFSHCLMFQHNLKTMTV